ncbi:NADP oxidoreductase [Streptomyces sp. WAC04770]|nr:NAD(P)-binding domain-containing protein [Streptomyces sp. WAC04770]RST20766.1 NADP oxidoreductase [Streptomyces sp. WAC04770]
MTKIGIIGAGEVGGQIARAALLNGYEVVLANSRAPDTLVSLVAWPEPGNRLPVEELAGKTVLDTNNYMAWRDGRIAVIDSGEKTEHEVRQEQLPRSRVAKAFTHIQAPVLLTAGRPPGDPGRLALSVSSDSPDAVALVTRLYDQFGFDTVDNSPLSESWRTAPGQPAWNHHDRQTRPDLARNLRQARFVPHTRP